MGGQAIGSHSEASQVQAKTFYTNKNACYNTSQEFLGRGCFDCKVHQRVWEKEAQDPAETSGSKMRIVLSVVVCFGPTLANLVPASTACATMTSVCGTTSHNAHSHFSSVEGLSEVIRCSAAVCRSSDLHSCARHKTSGSAAHQDRFFCSANC